MRTTSIQASRKTKHTPVGEIPAKWSVQRIGDFATVGQGRTSSPEHHGRGDGRWPWAKIADMQAPRQRRVAHTMVGTAWTTKSLRSLASGSGLAGIETRIVWAYMARPSCRVATDPDRQARAKRYWVAFPADPLGREATLTRPAA